MNYTEQTKEKLLVGLRHIGFTEDVKIVHTAGKDLVCDTACKVLQKMFTKAGLTAEVVAAPTGGREIIIGTAAVSEHIAAIFSREQMQVADVSDQDDGFEIKVIGDTIVIAGANGRGVLYGVFELEDILCAGAKESLDRFVLPAIRKRSHAVGYYWNHWKGMLTEEFNEAQAEYMARLRVNQYHGIQDGAGFGPHFYNLVKSDVFPWMNDPDPEYVRKTKKMSRLMREYGVDYFQWVIEPVLPFFAGNLQEYPEDVFGLKSPPDWFPNYGEGIEKTLCINHPMVQEYFFDVAKRFAEEYPDVKGIFLYNNDCQAWFCNPCECEKCQKAAIDPIGDRYILWENEMRAQNVINAGLRAGRADAESLFWPTVHFSEEEIRKMVDGTSNFTSLTTAWDGQDHDAMVPDAYDTPNYAITLMQEYEKKLGTPLYLYFAFNRSESLPQAFPYPYQMAHAMKRFYDWGLRNFVEGPGPTPHCNSINALTMKAVETNPNLDVDAFLATLCQKQFGEAAGKQMHAALREIKAGMDVWNQNYMHPFRGSHNELGMGPIMHVAGSINLDKDDPFRSYIKDFAYNAPVFYKDPSMAEKVQLVDLLVENAVHFEKAAEYAAEAVRLASSDEYITYAYYDLAAEGLECPTCKEYAEMNCATIMIAATFCREKVHKAHSARLFFDMQDCTNEEERKALHIKHTALVVEDLPLQEKILCMFEDFNTRAPQLTRVGMTPEQIAHILTIQKNKVAELHEYLETYKDEVTR